MSKKEVLEMFAALFAADPVAEPSPGLEVEWYVIEAEPDPLWRDPDLEAYPDLDPGYYDLEAGEPDAGLSDQPSCRWVRVWEELVEQDPWEDFDAREEELEDDPEDPRGRFWEDFDPWDGCYPWPQGVFRIS
jgi:hypothetical protein